MLEEPFFVYILASHSGTLYIGVTNHIKRRIAEHRAGIRIGFTKKYQCNRLIYIELFRDPWAANERERQLKRWSRKKKEWLVARKNPHWRDMASHWILPVVRPYDD